MSTRRQIIRFRDYCKTTHSLFTNHRDDRERNPNNRRQRRKSMVLRFVDAWQCSAMTGDDEAYKSIATNVLDTAVATERVGLG